MIYLVVRDRRTRAVREYYWLEGDVLRVSPNVVEAAVRSYNGGIADGGRHWLPADGTEFLKHLARLLGSGADEDALIERHDRPPAITPDKADIPEADEREWTQF